MQVINDPGPWWSGVDGSLSIIDLMARGIIKVDPLISAVAPLSEGPSWFNRLYNHEPNLMKVVLRP